MCTTFEIEIDGRIYEGAWSAGAYDRLTVVSDYGSTYAYRDGRTPEPLAQSLLAELIRRSARQAA